ncbi:hypothetical protein [Tritonibacter sp. SIMBA_163]|uniref:hypothetical protein n=1 Tax=Tritonibacter sp. SIMBA_163 TaxID=3080868 RepID=UPI00398191AB
MQTIAFLGKKSDIIHVREDLIGAEILFEEFSSEGFDGVTISTLIVDLASALAPPIAAVLAAKVATKKQVTVKVNGVEVNANTEKEAMNMIKELSEKE